MDLKGKTCLVTGAAKRLGKAIALEMARAGCGIALHYQSSRKEALITQGECRAWGVRCEIFKADLRNPRQIQQLASWVFKVFKNCEILVNSAAVFPRVALDQAVPEDFDLPYKVNLRAPALLTQAVGLQNYGKKINSRIINISDVGGMLAWPGYLPYSLSKAGVFQLTRASARLLAPYVLVNCVAPGPMLMPEKHSAVQKKSSLQRTLLKRLGGTEDVAKAVRFLAESDYITGATLAVDGGRLLAS